MWTKPTYSCFDPKVVGNVRGLRDRSYRNGCIFNEHYYLRWRTKFYDPCMSSAYPVRDACVKERFIGGRVYMVGADRKALMTSDRRSLLLYMPKESVAGFRGAWCMMDATKKNLQDTLANEVFDTEMKVRGGTTEFAKMVKTLP